MKELHEYRHFMKREEMHKSLNTLYGILTGIAADGVINEAEQNEVQNWYALHESLINLHPFKEILPVIRESLMDNVLDIEEVENVRWLCGKFLDAHEGSLYFDMITSEIQQLEGILHGLVSDKVLRDKELDKLSDWLEENEHLSGLYPFDEVYSLLMTAKADGVVTQDERNMLKAFFATFVDPRESYNLHTDDVAALQKEYTIGGICAMCPELILEGKTFCFTGVSKRGTRNDIAAKICEHGGSYNDRVTKGTDYLIVGAEGNPCWAYSCYGRKVEKAVDLRKSGQRILIIHENDLWDELGE